jgi:hypothetical protein
MKKLTIKILARSLRFVPGRLTALAVMSFIALTFIQINSAQTKREALTNAKIIEMVKLGLDDEIIVEKIRQSECQCDTSTGGLAQLKTAKVSNAIIMAMLGSSPGSRTDGDRNKNNSSNLPVRENVAKSGNADEKALSKISEPGIYLFENGEMKAIEPSVFSGTKMNPLMGALTYGIKKTKYRAKVRGKSANMQTAGTQPEFYFVFNPEYKNSGAAMAGLFWGMPATSPAEFVMVQMKQKEASREAVMGEYGTFTGMSMGARDEDIREYSFEKIKPGIYKVVPKTALGTGEYCFYYAGNVVGIGFAGGKVFDFTITGQKF